VIAEMLEKEGGEKHRESTRSVAMWK